MKQRFLSILLACCILLTGVPATAFGEDTAQTVNAVNADGFLAPIESPDAEAVPISTRAELNAIRDDLYGNYVLVNDIDLSGSQWNPIGSFEEPFRGKLDGQGHTVSGLSVNRNEWVSSQNPVGLFGACDGAVVKNLAVTQADVSVEVKTGYVYNNGDAVSGQTINAGILSGYADNSTVIYNCHTSGNVAAWSYSEGRSHANAGGLLGRGDTVLLSYSYNGAAVQATNGDATESAHAYAGGLAGRIDTESVVDHCFNTGGVTADNADYGMSYAGGLVGYGQNAEVTDSFNEGAVYAKTGNMFCSDAYAGGVAAWLTGTVDRVYNSGSVTAWANDPYGIDDANAWAGGVCGTGGSTVQNSAVVQTTVSATGSGTEYQYRIAHGGTKSNNITVSTVTAGSVNDADHAASDAELKTAEPYMNVLGWDFVTVWEMAEGKDYPQLMQMDVESEIYQQEYISQHLEFVNNGGYQSFMDGQRWAQIYWSAENTWQTQKGEIIYDAADGFVNLVTLNFGELFSDGNTYELLLSDYILAQANREMVQTFDLKLAASLIKNGKRLKEFITINWKPEFGVLHAEDLDMLAAYVPGTPVEYLNSDFSRHVHALLTGESTAPQAAETFGVENETWNALFKGIQYTSAILDDVYDINYRTACLDAYRETDLEFRLILEEMARQLEELEDDKHNYRDMLQEALLSYIEIDQALNEEDVSAAVETEFLQRLSELPESSVLQLYVKDHVKSWIKSVLSPEAYAAYFNISLAADVTWTIMEFVTKNGEIMECREMLRANAYFENVTCLALDEIKDQFTASPTYENACLFDTGFRFLKSTEIMSINTAIAYLDAYQSSWAGALRNGFNSCQSAIEEAQLNKLQNCNTYCHGQTYTLGGKVITIACPTDVLVYDENGVLAASIEDNAVTYCADGVFAYTADGVKLIAVPADRVCSVQINATGDGSMSYMVAEYGDAMEKVRRTVYHDVTIQKDEIYHGATDSSDLTDAGGAVVEGAVVIEAQSDIPVETVALTNAPETLTVGETVRLQARITPENASVQTLVWSTSDSSVLSVREDGALTALAEGEAAVTAWAINGTAFASATVYVFGSGKTILLTEHPADAAYETGETALPLTVTYRARNENALTFQWFRAMEEDLSDAAAVEGAAEASFTPPTDQAGTFWYYVTLTDGETTVSSEAAAVTVTEPPEEETVLTVTAQPQSARYFVGDAAAPLTVTYESSRAVSVQWYAASDPALSGGAAIPGADADCYTPSTETAGTVYYYAVLTAGTKSVASQPAQIVVEEQTELASGTVGDLTWVLTMDGELVISGTGQLPASRPWSGWLTEIRAITVADTVTAIAEGAFSGCTALTELTIPFVGLSRTAAGETGVLGAVFGKTGSDGVLQYCTQSGDSISGYYYAIPASLGKVTVTDASAIPFGAFSNCAGLTEVLLNDGVQTVSGHSFHGCTGLTELMFPDSVTRIQEYALMDCTSLERLIVPFIGTGQEPANSYDRVLGSVFGRSDQGVVQYSVRSGDSISGYYYAIPASLTTVIVTGETEIAMGAFSNCTGLTGVFFNEEVTGIGLYAFYNCTGLTCLEVSANVTAMDSSCFTGCANLTVWCWENSAAHQVCQAVGQAYYLLDGHSHSLTEELLTESTCTRHGLRLVTCGGCGWFRQELTEPAHRESGWILLEGTPLTGGVRVKRCTVCGAELDRETFEAQKPQAVWDEASNVITVTNVPQGVTAFAAVYENGQMVGCAMGTDVLPLTVHGGQIRVFFLDETLSPVCEAITIP